MKNYLFTLLYLFTFISPALAQALPSPISAGDVSEFLNQKYNSFGNLLPPFNMEEERLDCIGAGYSLRLSGIDFYDIDYGNHLKGDSIGFYSFGDTLSAIRVYTLTVKYGDGSKYVDRIYAPNISISSTDWYHVETAADPIKQWDSIFTKIKSQHPTAIRDKNASPLINMKNIFAQFQSLLNQQIVACLSPENDGPCIYRIHEYLDPEFSGVSPQNNTIFNQGKQSYLTGIDYLNINSFVERQTVIYYDSEEQKKYYYGCQISLFRQNKPIIDENGDGIDDNQPKCPKFNITSLPAMRVKIKCNQ